MLQSHSDKDKMQTANYKRLEKQLQQKTEECVVQQKDKVKFKELSEGYMRDIARLEAQLEQVDVKPRSKLSQRPKDTVMRDQTHSLSNIHPGRVKTVDKQKLLASCMYLKLLLQTKNLIQDDME